MKTLQRFPFTLFAAAIGAVISSLALFADLDLLRTGLTELENFQGRATDEVLLGILLLLIGIGLDAFRTHLSLQLQARRLETLKTTMSTVQDVVGNGLNGMTLLRIEAAAHVSEEALQMFDDIVRDTTQKIARLANIHAMVEKSMAGGPAIQYEPESTHEPIRITYRSTASGSSG